jgi:uncharacterized protein YbaR (Trm112 family)
MVTIMMLQKFVCRSFKRSITHIRYLSTKNDTNGSKLLDESIMEYLVCPISKYPVRYDAERGLIICPEIRVAYPIRNGIPILVPTEGRILKDDEEA